MNERVQRELARELGAELVSTGRLFPEGAELPLAAPDSAAGFAAALALARRERWSVLPLGSGSKSSWTRASEGVDFLLSTRNFRGVVAYEPGDGTLTARAGSSMAELAEHVARGGHALTPDVPRPRQSTLGGVIAAGQNASDRLRYGPVRDHVLGLSFALADGTVAKSGGRLVKNVTGYDLQRLFTGSHGTLGVILEASLRLYPLPEDECVLTGTAANRADLLAVSRALLAADLRPLSLIARRSGANASGRWAVALRLGGRREVVASEAALAQRLLPGAAALRGAEASAAAEALRDAAPPQAGGPLLRVDALPADFAAALEQVELLVATEGAAGPLPPRWWCEPGIGRIDVEFSQQDPALQAWLATSLRATLAPLRARARLLHAAPDVPVDPQGEPRAGLELMRGIRARLDPERVFAGGRFAEAR